LALEAAAFKDVIAAVIFVAAASVSASSASCLRDDASGRLSSSFAWAEYSSSTSVSSVMPMTAVWSMLLSCAILFHLPSWDDPLYDTALPVLSYSIDMVFTTPSFGCQSVEKPLFGP
jgi:hypothetical protein